MSDYKDIIRLGVDAYKGQTGKYSSADSLEVLRQALIDANGGSTKLNYKRIRDGQCMGLFSIVEEILARTIVDGLQGDEYGNFFGTPVVATPQRHKLGSSDFVFDDKTIHVVAGDDKPIKCVYEGESTVILGDPLRNRDMTQEYLYGEKYGMGIVLSGGNAGVGRYQFT